MGRTRSQRHGRLKASTLLETVLAMALMAGELSFALWMHVRILTTDRAMLRLQAWSLTEQVLGGTDASTLINEGNGVEYTVERTPMDAGMEHVTLTCSAAGRVILVRQCIQARP